MPQGSQVQLVLALVPPAGYERDAPRSHEFRLRERRRGQYAKRSSPPLRTMSPNGMKKSSTEGKIAAGDAAGTTAAEKENAVAASSSFPPPGT